MKLPSVANVLATLLSATAVAIGAESFEETLVVKLPRTPHGYRGMPGDIVQLKDGSLLMSYTGDRGIMAVKSPDRANLGHTLRARRSPCTTGQGALRASEFPASG